MQLTNFKRKHEGGTTFIEVNIGLTPCGAIFACFGDPDLKVLKGFIDIKDEVWWFTPSNSEEVFNKHACKPGGFEISRSDVIRFLENKVIESTLLD
jgi:hypothetical protein